MVLLDTAGRLQVDEEMMQELADIQAAIQVDYTIFVVDAMTGQDAVNVAKTFNEKIEIDGVILTKLDGDTRGGAALSIRAVTGKPILYVGMGEKLEDLQQFHPDRMASRILGMGDVLTLIDKATAEIDEEKAREMTAKMRKAQFTYNDLLDSMQQIRNMGGVNDILSMVPGMSTQLKGAQVDESQMGRIEAIIGSMTPEEREHPELMNPSRKKRIAAGSGVTIAEVNKLAKTLDQMKSIMKQMNGGGMKNFAKRGRFRFPFSF